MGAGFRIQIVNATPFTLTLGDHYSYQMEWNPIPQISPNSCQEFYAEFKETLGQYSIDDKSNANYLIEGWNDFNFWIDAKKTGVDNLRLESESGYGVSIEWQNIPDGFFVFPTPDTNNHSSIGWIHDGVVSLGIGYFPNHSQSRISPYPTPNYGDGILNTEKTALKPSVKHWANNWMELFAPCLENLCLNELTIPGNHDAGTYAASGITQSWVQTQYLSIEQQLQQGARALDLRLIIGEGSGDDRFELSHGGHTFDLTLVNVLNQINSFLQSTSQEIIILDFHDFEEHWDTQDYQDVANLIIKTIGSDKLIPPSGISQPLKEIWKTSGRVVVGSREFPDNMSGWLQENTPFWNNSVEQHWCGTSMTTWSNVSNYLQQEIDNISQPKNWLWSLMAQYNYIATGGVPGLPANIPQELSSFFAGLNGLKSNIIATDWWNRVNSTFGQVETDIPNFSTLINAVPLNILKAYRKANNLSLW